MESSGLANWIRTVHDALVESAVEQSGATWGPVRLRHRSLRPLWFGDFGRAWAKPVATHSDSPDNTSSTSAAILRGSESLTVNIDLISGALTDLPAHITPPAITVGDLGARGEVLSSAGDDVKLVWGLHSGEILGWDQISGRAICLRLEPPDGYETVSPLRSLVHWGTIAGGGVLLHGASVGRRRSVDESVAASGSIDGLLLVGEAGYGKSTSTLACLKRGWVTSGDDAVALFPDEIGWHAHAIYAAVKTKIDPSELNNADLDTADLDITAVDTRAGDTANPASAKLEVSANDSPATDAPSSQDNVVTWTIAGRKRAHLLTSTDEQLLVDSIRLSGIVVLDPDADRDGPWRPITAAAARNCAAPSSALPLPYHRAEILERIGALVRSLPSFLLPRRADLDGTVADLSDILDRCEPEVSVIIPVFNGERFIDDALESVVAQTVGRLQIIVVSDASPDGSVACVEAWRTRLESLGHCLLVIEHETNQGVAQARNTGIDASTSDLLAFLDQDDLWSIDHLAILLTALNRSDAHVALGGVSFVDLGGSGSRSWIRDVWFERDHAGHVLGAMLCRRSAFEELGMLDSQKPGNDDLDWLMRLSDSDLPVVETNTIVLQRRVHEANQSQHVPKGNKYLLSIVRDHLERTR